MQMNPPPPRVTIVMPLYNAAEFVAAAIASLQAQTFPHWNLLVINDASTDESPAIVAALAAKDPRITLLHNNSGHKGAGAARNIGMDAATGEYILMADADDLSHPRRIAAQLAFMDAHPRIAMSGCWARAFGQRGGVLWPFPFQSFIRATALVRYPFVCASVMLRASAVTQRYPVHFSRSEDAYFCTLIAMRHRVANIPKLLYHYRFHPGSLSHRAAPREQAAVYAALISELHGFTPDAQQLEAHLALRGQLAGIGVRRQAAWLRQLLRQGRFSPAQKALVWACCGLRWLAGK